MESMIITVMEIIGTVAFAISGSIIAARYGLDLFGVVLVGCVTAVCGGMIRDVMLGSFPPMIFSNKLLLLIAAVTSILVFIIAYLNASKIEKLEKRIETANILFDAIGLATFSVAGMEVAFGTDHGGNALLTVSMGVITGIGGGIVRDILVDKIPYVLKKHIYALASITGSVIYYLLRINISKICGLFVAIPVIITIRLLAARYHWKLPRIRIKNGNE
ncbi:MAG: trimeric intracellular cation channel family protein [Clostridia bacterium]|nr:trimeric intracellular cation channel family protein [Clostridia bacterium]